MILVCGERLGSSSLKLVLCLWKMMKLMLQVLVGGDGVYRAVVSLKEVCVMRYSKQQ